MPTGVSWALARTHQRIIPLTHRFAHCRKPRRCWCSATAAVTAMCALNDGVRCWPRAPRPLHPLDVASGVLECEAGVLISEIIALALPRGWFPPVTPAPHWSPSAARSQ